MGGMDVSQCSPCIPICRTVRVFVTCLSILIPNQLRNRRRASNGREAVIAAKEGAVEKVNKPSHTASLTDPRVEAEAYEHGLVWKASPSQAPSQVGSLKF